MKHCKSCGTFYSDAAGVCPRCNASLEQIPDAPKLSGDELKARRKKDWIGVLIGVPALIGLIYVLYFLIKLIQR